MLCYPVYDAAKLVSPSVPMAPFKRSYLLLPGSGVSGVVSVVSAWLMGEAPKRGQRGVDKCAESGKREPVPDQHGMLDAGRWTSAGRMTNERMSSFL